jgi:hypothetical protein
LRDKANYPKKMGKKIDSDGGGEIHNGKEHKIRAVKRTDTASGGGCIRCIAASQVHNRRVSNFRLRESLCER